MKEGGVASLLFAFTFCLFAFAAFADDLSIAREALRDGLWQVARTHAEKVGGEEASLIILESFASENRWEDVKTFLAENHHDVDNPAFAYYHAASEGRIDEAIRLLRLSGEAAEPSVKMLEADLLVKKNDQASARKLWRDVLTMTNASERARAVASVNLGEVEAMRGVYSNVVAKSIRQMVALRLGRALVEDEKTFPDGERLIRALVADSPDFEGAREAFLSLIDAEIRFEAWTDAAKTSSEMIEIWPESAKNALVREYRGTAFAKLNRNEEALAEFARAREVTEDDAMHARLLLKEGESLTDLGRGEEAMARYRQVLEKYPSTETAAKLKRVVALHEKETQGRALYGEYRFEEARTIFAELAREDASRADRMAYYEVLCLYGLGQDELAFQKATTLAEAGEDSSIRAEATLWVAKFSYNRKDWGVSVKRFLDYVGIRPESASAPSALLWATRAAFAANDYTTAIATATKLVETYPSAHEVSTVLVIQAEMLIERARFDEAILVLERVTLVPSLSREDKLRAAILKADAFFALGADNSIRYENALEAYRAVFYEPNLDPTTRLQVAFKIGRVLEKLKRQDEAIDQYYSGVVLAYRSGRMNGVRFGEDARAVFSRAAFRLADLFEGRGRDRSAVEILRLVEESAVPSAPEATKRIERILKKGRFL